VARTKTGDYWAIQCKCYQEDVHIYKPQVDTFLAASGKSFYEIFATPLPLPLPVL
jgi:predicted helicase